MKLNAEVRISELAHDVPSRVTVVVVRLPFPLVYTRRSVTAYVCFLCMSQVLVLQW